MERPNPVPRTDPIERWLGPFGRYQLRIFFCLFVGQSIVNILVPTRHVPPERFPYYCNSPDNYTDPCSSECSEVRFNKSDEQVSVITEWQLICDKAVWTNHQYSAHLLGYILGALAMGNGADGCGRRPTFLLSCVGQMCFGALLSSSPAFSVYCFFSFLVAFSTAGIVNISFVLLMEIVGAGIREYIVVVFKIPIFLGHIFVPMLFDLERNWRIFNLYVAMPSLLFICNYWVVRESPRWLFVTGSLTKSVTILEKGALMNNRPTQDIKDNVESTFGLFQGKTTDLSFDMTDLFKNPTLRWHTIIISLNYISAFVTIPSLELFWPKIHNYDTNFYMNSYVVHIITLAGFIAAVLLLKFVGRKITQIIVHIVLGIALLASLLHNVLGHTFFAYIQLVTSFCYVIDLISLDLYACELFPTVVRASAIGLFSCIAFLVKLLIQLLPEAANTHPVIAIIFGLLSITSGGLCIKLPETKGLALPDTIEEGEKIGK